MVLGHVYGTSGFLYWASAPAHPAIARPAAAANTCTQPKEEAQPEPEEAPAPKKTGTGFSFAFGAPKAAKAEEPKQVEEPAPAKVGTLSARRARAPRAEVEEVVVEEAPKAGSGFNFFGTGKVGAGGMVAGWGRGRDGAEPSSWRRA